MSRTGTIVSKPLAGAEDINRAAHDFVALVSRSMEIDTAADYPSTLAANSIAGVLFAISQMGGLSQADAAIAAEVAVNAVAGCGAFRAREAVGA